ncbi:hypothetical protein TcasGA2_TC034953 [Tribolium castaneum]|uniref:Uncharacterized protein n=1 Tax=Tribolium castaneum TaxID=7070 RepID=A0A139W9V7_TRICA|nr:hypothetical protein TcasGA2_TC034953 [Tribolium castaneum]
MQRYIAVPHPRSSLIKFKSTRLMCFKLQNIAHNKIMNRTNRETYAVETSFRQEAFIV